MPQQPGASPSQPARFPRQIREVPALLSPGNPPQHPVPAVHRSRQNEPPNSNCCLPTAPCGTHEPASRSRPCSCHSTAHECKNHAPRNRMECNTSQHTTRSSSRMQCCPPPTRPRPLPSRPCPRLRSRDNDCSWRRPTAAPCCPPRHSRRPTLTLRPRVHLRTSPDHTRTRSMRACKRCKNPSHSPAPPRGWDLAWPPSRSHEPIETSQTKIQPVVWARPPLHAKPPPAASPPHQAVESIPLPN